MSADIQTAWQVPLRAYCAYERAIYGAKTDAEAVARFQQIKQAQPNWRPDHYSSNTWGPLHLSVGRRWVESTR